VLELAGKVLELLKGHPIPREAKSALVIAGELLSLDSPTGVFFGSITDKGLQKKPVPI
jgi:hypothetical protein